MPATTCISHWCARPSLTHRWWMYNTAYSCIKATDRRIGRLQRSALGSHGRPMGYCAILCRISPAVLGIYVGRLCAARPIRLYTRLCSSHRRENRHIAKKASIISTPRFCQQPGSLCPHAQCQTFTAGLLAYRRERRTRHGQTVHQRPAPTAHQRASESPVALTVPLGNVTRHN